MEQSNTPFGLFSAPIRGAKVEVAPANRSKKWSIKDVVHECTVDVSPPRPNLSHEIRLRTFTDPAGGLNSDLSDRAPHMHA